MAWLMIPTVISLAVSDALWPARPVSSSERAESELPRRPELGLTLEAQEGGGAKVARVRRGSAAERVGLVAGDVVLRIDGKALPDGRTLQDRLRTLLAGKTVSLETRHQGRVRTVRFELPPVPRETFQNAEVHYGHVTTDRGIRVRTIVTRPKGATGPLPAMMLVPWLSCDPVETPHGADDGWSHLLRGLAEKSGWVIMRVEKPGVGDSEGPDCSQNDLETDLGAYRAGLAALRRLPFVDSARIVLIGSSLGGALAPLLAREQPVAGLIVSGGFTKTWYEHMLEFERARLLWRDRPASEVNAAMTGFAQFYAAYLGERKSPGEVMKRRPDLAPLWYDEADGQFGRPASFYHQVARLNVEAAWSQITSPTLVLYGEYDWIMSRDDHERAAALVNAAHPGRATLVILPRTTHNLDRFDSRADAQAGRNGRFDEAVLQRILEWLDQSFR
ncbi:MAG TPA: alpha/beta fold hydrolase [Candidatus Eisenbacteria bacterium]|nr:alpha/beta fold hydrolase [Candidatus Eisenbacteria bacterium]